jgi:hypothetical protein
LTVSEQPEQTSGEPGSLSAGASSHSADTPIEPVAASEASHASADAKDATKDATETGSEPTATEMAVTGKSEPHAPEASKPEISQLPGKVIVMSRGDRAWADNDIHAEPEDAEHHGAPGKRRFAAMAAVVALAMAAGVLGGALATSAFTHSGGSDVASNSSPTSVEASLSRIDADIQALKSGLDHTSKLGMNQFNKTSERLDKVERAQADPSAKIAKLSEAVEKLRAASVASPVVAAAVPVAAKDTAKEAVKETTGSIAATPSTPAPAQQAAATPPKPEVGRLPTLEDWVLRDVGQGAALIGGRRGEFEVYAGDFVPGLGRIDAIRRQDGRWVVVTSKGLIVAR